MPLERIAGSRPLRNFGVSFVLETPPPAFTSDPFAELGPVAVVCATGGPDQDSDQIIQWAEGSTTRYACVFGQVLTRDCECLAAGLKLELDTLVPAATVVIMRSRVANAFSNLNCSLAKYVQQLLVLKKKGKLNSVACDPFTAFWASDLESGAVTKLLKKVQLGSVCQTPCLELGSACSRFATAFENLLLDNEFTAANAESYAFMTSWFIHQRFQVVSQAFSKLAVAHGAAADRSSIGKKISAYMVDPASAVTVPFASFVIRVCTFTLHALY
jgi:hypothetical protein